MSDRAVIVLTWDYDPKVGPGFDAVIRAVRPHVPDGVHAYAAIRDTAQAVLDCFDEDAHPRDEKEQT